MNRRQFARAAAGLPLLAAATPAAAQANDPYPAALKSSETGVERLLAIQRPDGGLLDQYEIPQPGSAAGIVSGLTGVYLAPESRYHRSKEVLAGLLRAAEYLRRAQHEDGTIDLLTTNFGSPPDVAFALEPAGVAALLLRERKHPETRPVELALETFIRRGAGALQTGGIHTPNHRWVVVGALARCHQLFPDPRSVARIDQWLAEGMDLDAEAQYNERSAGVYNPITNNVLVQAGRLLNRPALFDPVRKNLEAMLYFLHPNGEVLTDISRRQDRFQRATMRNYYRSYRYLARHDRNGRFATMADRIATDYPEQMGGELVYFLESPALRADDTPREAVPDNYDRHFRVADLAHIRRRDIGATVLGGHSRFFSFRGGGAVVEAVRFASAFFGKGQFMGPIEKREGGYRIEQTLVGDYRQPLDPKDRRADGDWAAMPHDRRARTNVFRLRSSVAIVEKERGFDLVIESAGTEPVPLAVEITLRAGGRLTGDAVEPVAGATGVHLLREGYAVYENEGRRVRFGPGFRRHAWTQVRGAEPRLDGLSVYLTDFTPVKRTLEFRAV